MKRYRAHLSLFLVLVLVLAGCAGAKGVYTGLVTSGETLNAVGKQFVSISALYKAGCDSGQIKPAECAAYRKFGEKFKLSYPIAVALWESARAANDAASEKAARDAILQLSTELTALAAQAYIVFGGN